MWQDIALMVGGFCFAVALVPTLKAKEKPARSTSIITGGILTMFCIVYATLGLWLGCISGGLTAIIWFILFYQGRRK